jgi:hypothetical protein
LEFNIEETFLVRIRILGGWGRCLKVTLQTNSARLMGGQAEGLASVMGV